MDPHTAVGHGILAVDLNSPGSYINWSIFTISVANLVLIAVMVVIFGAALLLPFPGRHGADSLGTPAAEGEEADSAADVAAKEPPSAADPDSRMWTARVRRRALAVLPPGKLLPDRQPAYVASWIYVFGVASLAALRHRDRERASRSRSAAPDWWHTNPVGHFFNSLHLWSVELFMAFMVIHLWGKFWMAAWRGRRWLTWMTGVVAFVASVVECFTGYLSQQNFDSQWISTNGKDAFNAVGVGAFFNLMNFGQMLLWHVVLVPIVLVALDRRARAARAGPRGEPPAPGAVPELAAAGRELRALASRPPGRAAGGAGRRCGPVARAHPAATTFVKEGTIAALIALVLTVGLASVLSSPDVPPVTVRSWAQVAPADFIGTAASELNGTSETASYGPPYNTNGTPQSESGRRGEHPRRGPPADRHGPDVRA